MITSYYRYELFRIFYKTFRFLGFEYCEHFGFYEQTPLKCVRFHYIEQIKRMLTTDLSIYEITLYNFHLDSGKSSQSRSRYKS